MSISVKADVHNEPPFVRLFGCKPTSHLHVWLVVAAPVDVDDGLKLSAMLQGCRNHLDATRSHCDPLSLLHKIALPTQYILS